MINAADSTALLARVRRIAARALRDPLQRRLYLKRAWDAVLPVPLPWRLPYGGLWLARRDVIGTAVVASGYHQWEWQAVSRIVRPGTTVVDGGAHQGFFTLLLSRLVRPGGRVIAFEPSARERRRLRTHLLLNGASNVTVEPFGLGDIVGVATLFVVNGRDTGCNSLRPPDVNEPTEAIEVPVITLDEYARTHRISTVDFLKLDLEGAELHALRGAERLLSRRPRPFILCEVEQRRTMPWGYHAQEILGWLAEARYACLSAHQGRLVPVGGARQDFQGGNVLAVPRERLDEVHRRLGGWL